MQVNHSPSFSIDTPLDLKVKEALITDTLKLVRMDPMGYTRMRQQVTLEIIRSSHLLQTDLSYSELQNANLSK